MDEKADIIIQKIQYLQKLVQDYSNSKENMHSNAHQKDYPKPTPEQMKEFGNLEINEDLQGRSYFLLSSGKKIRNIRNRNLTRRFLDLWISALIHKLLQNSPKTKIHSSQSQKKQKSTGHQSDNNIADNSEEDYDQISDNNLDLDTDDLINDPGAEEANQIAQNISDDIDL